MTDAIIQREALDNFRRLENRISALEGNDYYGVLYGESSWGNTPPSASTVIGVFGQANRYNRAAQDAVLRNVSNNQVWKLTAVRSTNRWYYTQMTAL